MTRIHCFLSLVSVCLYALASSAFSQDVPYFRWGVSAGLNHYQEPGLMQLHGPEIGVHATRVWPSIQAEGDILLGQQTYSSHGSGSMTGITNLETRWRGLVSLADDLPTHPNFLAGLAIHTLWNDLRGTTTFNQTTYGGYERSAVQLWLPIRWSHTNVWDVDAGLLIYGRHISKLSQVNSHYTDLVNTQHRGQYVQATFHWAWDDGDTLKPLIRYTHLGKSHSVVMNGSTWVEPASQRWQIGVIWEFNPR